MSKQWHVQQSTAEQLYEQTPDETVQLIWTDPPFGTDQLQVGSEHSYQDGTVAYTLALIDHQQAAIDAAAEAWWRRDYPEYGPWQDAVAERPEWASEIRADCAAELAAATPHLRAAWEQPIRELCEAAIKRANDPLAARGFYGEAFPATVYAQDILALLEGGAE